MKRRPWTTKEIEYLKEFAGRRTDGEIAKAIGRTRSAVSTYRARLALPEKKAVYRIVNGDEILAIGTADECARILGIKKETVYNYLYRPYNRTRYAERIK